MSVETENYFASTESLFFFHDLLITAFIQWCSVPGFIEQNCSIPCIHTLNTNICFSLEPTLGFQIIISNLLRGWLMLHLAYWRRKQRESLVWKENVLVSLAYILFFWSPHQTVFLVSWYSTCNIEFNNHSKFCNRLLLASDICQLITVEDPLLWTVKTIDTSCPE